MIVWAPQYNCDKLYSLFSLPEYFPLWLAQFYFLLASGFSWNVRFPSGNSNSMFLRYLVLHSPHFWLLLSSLPDYVIQEARDHECCVLESDWLSSTHRHTLSTGLINGWMNEWVSGYQAQAQLIHPFISLCGNAIIHLNERYISILEI